MGFWKHLGGDGVPEDAAESRGSASAGEVGWGFDPVAKPWPPAQALAASVTGDVPGRSPQSAARWPAADPVRASAGTGLGHAVRTVASGLCQAEVSGP